MITLYGYSLELYQVILSIYVIGYGIVLGLGNTFARFMSLFTRSYHQSDLGKVLDSMWYGCIFVLIGTLL